MKWIGQHIWGFISRFRNDVYLEDISNAGEDTDKFLVAKSDGRVAYRSGSEVLTDIGGGLGDITGVTITTDSGGGSAASDTSGSADFSILGSNGVNVTNSGTTITASAVPGEIDHDSLNNFVAAEHYDWASDNSGTATIHTNNITDLHGAGVNGSVNQLLTDDGDGSVTSESSLTYSSESLIIGNDDDGSVNIKRQQHSSDNGGDMLISAGGPSLVPGSSNKSGGDLKLMGGYSTGTGTGGSVKIQTVKTTNGTATTLNAWTDTITVSGANVHLEEDVTLSFEGGSDNGYETTLTVTDPSADRTITLPNATGTVALTSNITKQIYIARQVENFFYFFTSNTWYPPTGNFNLNYSTGSTPNTTTTGATLAHQVEVPLIVAISDMVIYKVLMNWRWQTKSGTVAGDRPFEFSFHTSTPPNDSIAEQTLSTALSVTDNDGNYTNDKQYITAWDIDSGNGVTLSAGEALNMFSRMTSPAGTLNAPAFGNIWLEYKYV
jgi:hypothetical protein